MNTLLNKLNYKNQERILILNAEKAFIDKIKSEKLDIRIDTSIDPRYLYEIILIFVKFMSEVENTAPAAIHNLIANGILWYAFPKKACRNLKSDLDKDHGWGALFDRGFDKIRLISIDENWSALGFKNIRFIRSVKYR
ncbi:MAG: hypothetical protein KBG40_04825 [Bacteroidales bacterium]|nr:hypothetical protein [Bacteroidales bacterium]